MKRIVGVVALCLLSCVPVYRSYKMPGGWFAVVPPGLLGESSRFLVEVAVSDEITFGVLDKSELVDLNGLRKRISGWQFKMPGHVRDGTGFQPSWRLMVVTSEGHLLELISGVRGNWSLGREGSAGPIWKNALVDWVGEDRSRSLKAGIALFTDSTSPFGDKVDRTKRESEKVALVRAFIDRLPADGDDVWRACSCRFYRPNNFPCIEYSDGERQGRCRDRRPKDRKDALPGGVESGSSQKDGGDG